MIEKLTPYEMSAIMKDILDIIAKDMPDEESKEKVLAIKKDIDGTYEKYRTEKLRESKESKE